jgi:hypothetical protein
VTPPLWTASQTAPGLVRYFQSSMRAAPRTAIIHGEEC